MLLRLFPHWVHLLSQKMVNYMVVESIQYKLNILILIQFLQVWSFWRWNNQPKNHHGKDKHHIEHKKSWHSLLSQIDVNFWWKSLWFRIQWSKKFLFTDFSIKYGQIGTGDTAQQTNPFLMFENATDIATGYLFSILLSHTGNVYHCGYNSVRILN